MEIIENNDNNDNKFSLCVFPTQMGKTFTVIERIRAEIEQDDISGRSLHIIFTMNTLLNNQQFANRLQLFEDVYGKNSVIVFASKYDGHYKYVKNLQSLKGECLDIITCPRIIVMCSNTIRFTDGIELIKIINRNNSIIERIFVYYDELHEYINLELREQIEYINSINIVKTIIGLTATPDKIFSSSAGFWNEIKIINLAEYNDLHYVGANDMNFITIDDYFELPYKRKSSFDKLDEETLGFINHTLTKHPSILSKGARVFIPAHIRRSGHEIVRNLIFALHKKTAIVITINGINKIIEYYNDDKLHTIVIDSAQHELSTIIFTKLEEHKINLKESILVITGFLCVGMGQTLTHRKIGSFTDAIISHLSSTNDEVYQLFGRLTGRMKHWSRYCKTNIYCPTTIMHRCTVMENCAVTMAKHFKGEIVTQDIYRAPMNVSNHAAKDTFENLRDKLVKMKTKVNKDAIEDNFESIWSPWFDNEEDCNQWWKDNGGHPRVLKLDKDGFKICSTTGSPYRPLITEIDNFKIGKKTANMPKANKLILNQKDFRRYVAYEDINNINTAKYCVHYIKKIL
jgi:hypothetical protein